jgi:hypothetical protein
VYINWKLSELNLKIVYYGPALSGKTTNLEQIHARVDPARRSELVSLKTHEDRTLFFDFLQLELGQIGGLTPKIHLYTVPGQTYYEASRRLVLRGADGVVFVADSAVERLGDNLESWRTLRVHLASLDIPWGSVPVVVQFNKQDVPNALAVSELEACMDVDGLTTFSSVATRGVGVFETLKAITREVIVRIDRRPAQVGAVEVAAS